MQIRHNPLSGGYCGEVPPLPIPNREVKLTCADGTAMQCGRVGSRLLLSRASITKVVGAFLFSYSSAFLSPSFFPQIDGRSSFYLFTLLPFYPFTFLPFIYFFLYSHSLHYRFSHKNDGEFSLVMFMYKMLTDCGFTFIKSAKLRTKMFLSTKKLRKFPPPIFIFFIIFAPRKCELSCKRLIYIITY